MYIQEPIEELVQCSGDNFGILSDFSDHNTDSSTPLVADHLEVGPELATFRSYMHSHYYVHYLQMSMRNCF